MTSKVLNTPKLTYTQRVMKLSFYGNIVYIYMNLFMLSSYNGFIAYWVQIRFDMPKIMIYSILDIHLRLTHDRFDTYLFGNKITLKIICLHSWYGYHNNILFALINPVLWSIASNCVTFLQHILNKWGNMFDNQ